MKKFRYKKYVAPEDDKKLSLSDALSVERTHLSNERTYLSYTRTAVSFIVAAISIYKLIPGAEGGISATILLVSALYFFVRGIKITRSVKNELEILDIEDA